ncbi:hypothetical protein B0O99DRAFT_213602 [Bisporella sp. PMI_857]|nr:hypothetical protein B0O99DRAFT_213602 [Bisporella sp. PMI_857]
MPRPRVSLRSFLSSAKSALKANQPTHPFTFVIGNESADLDSLCSAVVLAYLRTYASTLKSNTFYIPISNLPSADISLRPELIPVLSRADLKPSDLISLSDLPSSSQGTTQLVSENPRWVLVDHNSLQGELGKLYAASVVGCIDHHDDEGKVPKDCGEEPRIVRKSGSCASLVVDYCRGAWDILSENSEDEVISWDSQLAQLSLGPILIDTSNLRDEAKVTSTDVDAVEYLQALIHAENASFSRDDYFKEISKAKQDIGGLSLPDILKKDYKLWVETGDVKLGISSVVKDIKFLIDKAGSEEKFYKTLEDFAHERGLSLCCIMTTSNKDGTFQRELFVWARNEKGIKAAKKFEADANERLSLEAWNYGALDLVEDKSWRRCWRQHRVENSRKQVAPLLRTAISDGSRERL